MKKLFTLFILSCIMAMNAYSTNSYNLTLGSEGIGYPMYFLPTNSENNIGLGSWQNNSSVSKSEAYFDLTPYFGTGIKISDIAKISYFSKKNGITDGTNAPNFYLVLYTNLNGLDDQSSWYGYRLIGEPYFANNLNAPSLTWNKWSTESGTNQLRFVDPNKAGNQGFYGEPTFANIKSGNINWYSYYASSPITNIDYANETIKFVSLQTGSGWNSTFVGWLDNIYIELNNGDNLTINLENTHTVHNLTQNTYFNAIQPAINAANAGDVIECAAGTYAERVIISKRLTLQGASETATIIDGATLSGTGKGILINNGITGVTIQNLTVQNFAGSSGNADAGIYAIGGNSNLTVQHVTIRNNVGGSGFYANGPIDNVMIDDVTSSGHTTGARGIVIWNGLKSHITIRNCEVYNNNCCGIELQDGTASGVTMENNFVHNNGDNGMSATGLTSGAGPNVISNNTLNQNGRFGIEIKLPNGTGLSSGDGSILVSGNTVTGAAIADARDMAGIGVYRRGWVAGNNNIDIPTGVQVLGNTVTGYTQSSTSEGFGIVVEGTNHTVANNTLNNNDVGIQQQAGNLPYTANTGVDGDQTNKVDSYFGRGNSPIACGTTIIGNTFSSNGVDTRNVGAIGGAGYVANINTGKTFCSIQSAINDATTTNGHTIQVYPGTYNEQLTINKSLTINGVDGAILDGTGVTGHFSIKAGTTIPVNGWTTGVKIKKGDVTFNNIDVTNFTQDGIICGYEASTPGSLKNIHISNCKISNIQPGWWGFGIYAGYESEAFGTSKLLTHLDYSGLLIENNEITNTHSSALVLQSITALNGMIQVKNNNIHHNTENDGLWIESARNILINNNILSYNKWGIEFTALGEAWYTLNGPYSSKNISITGNEINNNSEEGFAIYNAWPETIFLNFNSIVGNGFSNKNFLSSSLFNAKYNWWGNCVGPLDNKTLPGNPNYNNTSGAGNGVGSNIDYSPWIGSGLATPSLWLSSVLAKRYGDDRLAIWQDASCNALDATQNLTSRQPVYDKSGFNGIGGVRFTTDYSSSGYGNSDVMTVPFNADVTSASTMYSPSKQPKNLYVVFQPGDVNNNDNHPYYSDGRKVIYEAGGPLSGYNLYILNGKLCMGMWNRFERTYMVYDPPTESSTLVLNPNDTYIARLRYNESAGPGHPGFYVTLACSTCANPSMSMNVTFSGLTNDGSDATGIGGAARTSFHDYNTGETYSNEFEGLLGDVMVYNKDLSSGETSMIDDYFQARYGVKFGPAYQKESISDWKVIKEYDITGLNTISTSYPNPFIDKSTFGISLVDGQNIIVELFDAQGQKVKTMFAGQLGSGIHEFTIDGQDLNSGLYMFRVTGDNFSESGKVILSK